MNYRPKLRAAFRCIEPLKGIIKRNRITLNSVNTLLIVLIALVVLGQKKAIDPVVFSKGIAITSFAKELNNKGVSEEKQRVLVNRFVRALPKALAHYAKTHHVVVLKDKEVEAGAPDITHDVLAYIAKEMMQQNQGTSRNG